MKMRIERAACKWNTMHLLQAIEHLKMKKKILYFGAGSMYDLSKDDYMWTDTGEK